MNRDEVFTDSEGLCAKVAELQELQAKYESMVEAFDGLIYICSSDYKVEFMNRRFIERTGRNAVGENCFEALHELKSVCPWCVNDRVLQGETVRWEVHSPKDRHWYYVVNTPIRHPDGSMSKMGMIHDITDRKRSELVLLARLRLVEYATSHSLEELLQATLDEVEALTESSISFYHFLDTDQRTLHLQAWSTRTLLEMCTAEGKGLHYDIDEAGVWADCVRERKPVIHNDYSALPHHRGIPTGHADVIRELVVPVFRGDRIAAILGVGNKAVDYDASDIETVSLFADLAWDIAERKQAEERLRLLDFALDHVREAALLIDENARFRFVNEESCRVLGYTRSELLGLGVPDIDPDFPMVRWPSHWEDLKTHGSLMFEGRHRTKDSRIFPVEINANYFEYEGQGYNLALVRDISGRKKAEQDRLSNLWFFKSMDRVNRAIQGTNDLEQMMSDVLDTVLSIFDCDRAFLMYPCDPQAATWTAPMERAKPEYPGVLDLGLEMPMDEQVAETLRILLNSDGPVKFGTGTEHALPEHVSENFGFKTFMSMALYPKVHKPWQFGIHQCSYPRVWTSEEERLFQEIGRRLEDGLSTLLAHRDLRESEERFRLLYEDAPLAYQSLDENGNYLAVNQAWLDSLGYFHDEVIGKWCGDFLTEEYREKFRVCFQQFKAVGELHGAEFEMARKDGSTILVAANGKIAHDAQGQFKQTHCILYDITERKRAQEAVSRANKDWEQTFKAIPDMVMVLDTQHRILRANKAMAAVLGRPEEELEGKFCFELVHDMVEPPAFCPHSILLNDGTEHSEEVFEPTLERSLDVRVSPLFDETSKLIGSVHVARDITERKQAESELQKSNDLLRAIIEAAPTAIAGLDLDGNVQLVWNPAAEKMLGWSAQEVMGRLLPSVPAEKQEEFKGFRERIRSGKTLDGVEVRRQKRDGTPIDYSIYASPLHDAEGSITGNVCVLVDITERKRSEEALRASEEKFRTLFEESIDGVYSVLRDGQITDANLSFCELFGYTREEMIGKNVLEMYVDPTERQRFQEEIEKKGFVKDYEVKLRKKDGREADCLVTVSVQFASDRSIIGHRGIMRDLTVHKSLQKQLLQAQKMESLGTLAGGVAHDFNNLLQIIIGYSDMLLFDKMPSDKEYEGLRAIHQAGKDGAELAKRILAFSRRLEPNALPVNLNNEIVRVQKMLERTVSKMIRIEIFLADNLMTVNADPGQMEQILLNLAVNAQHAMPDGGRLSIETANVTLDADYSRIHVDAEPGRYVLLSVSDTGHGMDKEVLEHIFEPFYTTKEADEGTGLGLAMVFGIVKSHKGHITCYSEPGAGTTFKIYLPVIAQEIKQDVDVTQQTPACGTETILLVDDEKSIRKFGEQMLRMAGYTVLTATNGREAFEIYRSNQDRIALVLLDLMMPEMGGEQCLEELLKINPRVKVVIASGYSSNGPTTDALASGAKGFVDKPYDVRQLLEVVRGVLDAE